MDSFRHNRLPFRPLSSQSYSAPSAPCSYFRRPSSISSSSVSLSQSLKSPSHPNSPLNHIISPALNFPHGLPSPPSSERSCLVASQEPPSLLIDEPPLPPPPDLDISTLTPISFSLAVENASTNVAIPHVTPGQLLEWESSYPEFVSADGVKYEYNSSSQNIIIKCPPLATHDSLQLYFCNRVRNAFASRSLELQQHVRIGSGTTFRGFEGDYDYSTSKLPDAYVQIAGTDFPSIVCEAGWAESLDDLLLDAQLWLLGTGFQTKIVIVLAMSEELSAALPQAGDVAGTDDSILNDQTIEKLVNSATTTKSLSQQILSLHRNNRLSNPLIGSVHGSLHVLRLDDKQRIVASFIAQVLPPPQPGDPGDVQSFTITMKTLFGDAPVPEEVSPEEEIIFDLAHLRKTIEGQIPSTERDRSITRAMNIMRRVGKEVGRETFAALKKKRKIGDTWNEASLSDTSR